MFRIKLAVISDIHGNIIALEEIIKDAELNDVDRYVASGDLINEIPCGDEVINKLKEINAMAIKGNKELYLLEYEESKYDWENLQFQNTVFMYEQLSEENKEYIRKLPQEINLSFEDVKIKIVHGSPDSIVDLIHEEDVDRIDEITKKLKEDLLILGHTHQVIWQCEMNGKNVVNAGCSGISSVNIGYAEYIIINIENGKFNIEKRLIKFEPEKLKDKIIKSGILKKDETLMNLVYLQLTGRPDIKARFFHEARDRTEEENRKLYRDNAKGIYKYFKLYDDDIWLELTEKYKKYFIL